MLAASLAAGCEDPGPAAQGYLFEKGSYQALYGPDGRILRLLFDGDGDGVAEAVTLFDGRGQPRRVEIDSDRDARVDTWQEFRNGSVLLRTGSSRRRSGRVDLWEYVDARGGIVRRELDGDGDGRFERAERFVEGRLVAVELDTDRSGAIDRWQRWQEGILVSEDLDIDGDGEPDRRLHHGAGGRTPRLERLGTR